MKVIFLGSKEVKKGKGDKEKSIFIVHLGKEISNGFEPFTCFTNKETFDKISEEKPFTLIDNLAIFFNHNESGFNNVYYKK